ncbi:unnamed protein product [Tuber melanosporum]|uniref:(Perigord truffle) hypothetical protein n=1 Tax=Tuber melanosporum (strain Mel28) TaxID=656061 RepID=D5GKE5_TUBMM|nr:uncharacterized protein GSTUM_00009502001 [Tuber melanosporum]CAZ84988.1 unnamed protein product [Tuber melanosporum]
MSKIAPLKTTNSFSSTSTASSTNSTPACSPTTSTSSNDSHTLKFFDKTLDKVKAYVPHHHHHQSKKTYSQPPTSIPQQHHRSRSTESLRSVQRRQTVAQYGRHSNEWLFGGVSVRRAVSGLFQQEN